MTYQSTAELDPALDKAKIRPDLRLDWNWVAAAKCRGQGCKPYFPRNAADPAAAALRRCADCPVVEPCQRAGTYEPDGFWGPRLTRRADGRALRRPVTKAEEVDRQGRLKKELALARRGRNGAQIGRDLGLSVRMVQRDLRNFRKEGLLPPKRGKHS